MSGCQIPMNEYVIAAAERPTVTVAGSTRRFPVHRIYCVGRNYAEHAREMGYDPTREPPFFFCKPADSRGHLSGCSALL